jgi:2-haloacid dehalogenase
MSQLQHVRALVFDVFGSVVDWRGSIASQLRHWGNLHQIALDWDAFARQWRAHYQPSLERVRSGQRAFVPLDELHRESLEKLLIQFGLQDIHEDQKNEINRVWHRLDAWPDSIAGLLRLKSHYTIAPLSNGNVALLNNMAKYAGLPWDLNLSTEWFQAYKPQPQTYLGAARALGLEPAEVMMCAAHNDDLAAARAAGLRTAFWPRPTEYGIDQSKDFEAQQDWDIIALDVRDLAHQLLDVR